MQCYSVQFLSCERTVGVRIRDWVPASVTESDIGLFWNRRHSSAINKKKFCRRYEHWTALWYATDSM